MDKKLLSFFQSTLLILFWKVPEQIRYKRVTNDKKTGTKFGIWRPETEEELLQKDVLETKIKLTGFHIKAEKSQYYFCMLM